jgi:glycogen phosphorylase
LIEQYLAGYAESELGITLQQLLALGRKNPDDVTESFNMAYLALRGSGAVNAVSSLHGRVSRHLFAPLFSRWPVDEVPVGHVTNGVHMPTWDSAAADAFWTKLCGKSRWMGEAKGMRSDVCCASNTELWQLRGDSRIALVDYARKRLSQQLAIRGVSSGEVEAAKHLFDSNTLTLGFARRFASYKRPDLLLHDPERLLRLLTNPQRPVQLIIAGKAHPADKDGQALILKWMQFIEQTEARAHVIFLSDYDMHLTQHMVQGVDVWVNTPRRPWEACGTSGMKVLVNGGINLSELDGWWAEAYTPEVGWAFGDGLEHDNDPDWDAKEAEALYDILENEVVPEFYSRDKQGIPVKWVSKMRESMSRLTPKFSTNRAVCEYTEKHYLTAAASYLERVANNGKRGDEIANWLDSLDQKWASLRFGEMKIESNNGTYLFEIQVYLDGLKADAVKVELYANGMGDDLFECIEMNRLRQLVGAENGYTYYAKVTSLRPAHDFTARIVPFYPGVVVPLEASHILWSH